MYRDYDANITVQDAESSDDGDDGVFIQLPSEQTLHPAVKQTVGSF